MWYKRPRSRAIDPIHPRHPACSKRLCPSMVAATLSSEPPAARRPIVPRSIEQESLVISVMKERCPRCMAETEINDDAFICHCLLSRPYLCGHCDAKFRPAGPIRAVYFLLGAAGITAACFVPRLLEMSKTNPDVEILSISVAVLVTISSTLILRLNRDTKLVIEGDRRDIVLHYISYGALPVALVAFAAAIFLAKQGVI